MGSSQYPWRRKRVLFASKGLNGVIFEVGRVIVDRSTLGQSCVVFWPSGQKGGALEKIWSLRLMLATFTGGNGDAGSLISSSEYSFHVSCDHHSTFRSLHSDICNV